MQCEACALELSTNAETDTVPGPKNCEGEQLKKTNFNLCLNSLKDRAGPVRDCRVQPAPSCSSIRDQVIFLNYKSIFALPLCAGGFGTYKEQ